MRHSKHRKIRILSIRTRIYVLPGTSSLSSGCAGKLFVCDAYYFTSVCCDTHGHALEVYIESVYGIAIVDGHVNCHAYRGLVV